MTKYIVKFQNWDDPMVIKTISEHKTYNAARKSLNKELKDNNYILTDDKWSDKYIRAGYIPGVLIYIYWVEDDKGNRLPLNYKEEDKVSAKTINNQGNNDDLLHITVHIGKFKIYRVFKSCKALHNYVQSILNKGYTAFGTEYNGKTEKWEQFKTTDWNTICSEIFEYGLILRKTTTNGKQSEIKIYEHKPQPKKKTK